jgi:2-isopropylmalate synthase
MFYLVAKLYASYFIEMISNLRMQALATTRVVLSPVVGGPNDNSPLISKERKFSGSGSDTDIVTSSARAYVSALNKLLSWTMRRQAQEDDSSSDDGKEAAVQIPSEAPTVVG